MLEEVMVADSAALKVIVCPLIAVIVVPEAIFVPSTS
jgi:hypothetical protein